MNPPLTLTASLATLALAACVTTPASPLTGGEWRVVEWAGRA